MAGALRIGKESLELEEHSRLPDETRQVCCHKQVGKSSVGNNLPHDHSRDPERQLLNSAYVPAQSRLERQRILVIIRPCKKRMKSS
jgi:hypothetical protein